MNIIGRLIDNIIDSNVCVFYLLSCTSTPARSLSQVMPWRSAARTSWIHIAEAWMTWNSVEEGLNAANHLSRSPRGHALSPKSLPSLHLYTN